MTTNEISRAEAIAYAVLELGLEYDKFQCISAEKNDGMCEIVIRTICMEYTAFVDAKDGSVPGIISEPHINLEAVYSGDYKIAA